MIAIPSNKRRAGDSIHGKTARPKKRIRKQKEYHSSSEDSAEASENDFAPVNLEDSDENDHNPADPAKAAVGRKAGATTGQGSDSDDDLSLLDDEANGENGHRAEKRRKPTSKRNNPEAFSTSISKILSTKLSQGARKDPVLSRSREAAEASSGIANERLERRAKAQLRADRKEALERGRVKDVLGLQSGRAGEVAEEENRLRKIAQRGVVKLFNAVRAAQVKGEEAAKEARKKGAIGHDNREGKINEMSKQGFLDLINGNSRAKPIEEAR